MPDQRVVVFGGNTDGYSGIAQTNLTIFNANTSTMTAHDHTFLKVNLYPAIYLLPTAHSAPHTYTFFVFSSDQGDIVELGPDDSITKVGNTPKWPMWEGPQPFYLSKFHF
jgi:hypothetical protein